MISSDEPFVLFQNAGRRGVGSAISLNLQDEVELWKEGREFLPVRKNEVRRIFELC